MNTFRLLLSAILITIHHTAVPMEFFWATSPLNPKNQIQEREEIKYSLAPASVYDWATPCFHTDYAKTIGSRAAPLMICDNAKTLLAMHLCLFHPQYSSVRLPKDLIAKVIAFMPEYIPSFRSFEKAYNASCPAVRAELISTCKPDWAAWIYKLSSKKDRNIFLEKVVPLVVAKRIENLKKFLSAVEIHRLCDWEHVSKYITPKEDEEGREQGTVIMLASRDFLIRFADDTKTHTDQLTQQVSRVVKSYTHC